METTLLLSIFHVFTSFPLISCKIFPSGPILGWKVEPGVAHPWKCRAEGEQITFLSLPAYSLFLLEKSAIVNSTSASHPWACQSFTKISQYIIVCASSISARSLSRKLRWLMWFALDQTTLAVIFHLVLLWILTDRFCWPIQCLFRSQIWLST